MLLTTFFTVAAAAAARPNVLIVLVDDVGVDRIAAYAEHPDPGATPNIDRLAREGLLFRNAWAHPLCSVSRGSLLTGLLPCRTKIGNNIEKEKGHPLQAEDLTLPEALAAVGVPARMVGKWHLSRSRGQDAPRTRGGFERYSGPLHNLGADGGDYLGFTKTVDGVPSRHRGTYATTDQVDDMLRNVSDLEPPWFLLLSTSAGHGPLHRPPRELHTRELAGHPDDDKPAFQRAVVEALDTELGRLLAALPANTYVVFMADNGTAKEATDAPFLPEHAKGTMYEGGLNVPLIVWGPGVAPGECSAPVHITDVFATVAELMGVSDPAPEDSVSMVPYLSEPGRTPLRQHVVSESFTTKKHRWAVLDTRRFKLIRIEEDGQERIEELYDLEADPWESRNLLGGTLEEEAAAHLEQLGAVLDGLR